MTVRSFAALALGFLVFSAPAQQPTPSARGRLLGQALPAEAMSEHFDPAGSAGLFVGIRSFAGPEGDDDSPIAEVPFAADDAVDLAHLFGLELGLIPPDRITVAIAGDPQKEESKQRLDSLLEAGARRSPGTLSALLRQVMRTSTLATDEGLLVMSFATHGFSSGGESLLLASDSWMGNLEKTTVTLTEILAELADTRARRRLVMLDACRERVSESRGLGGDAHVSQALVEQLGKASGTAILMATVAGGFSYDDPARRNGVFTGALLDGLQGHAAPDAQGFITLQTLSEYASGAVEEWVRANRSEHAEQSTGISVWYESMSAFEMPLATAGEVVAQADVAPVGGTSMRSVWVRREDGALYTKDVPVESALQHVLFLPPALPPYHDSMRWAVEAYLGLLTTHIEQHPLVDVVNPIEERMVAGSGLGRATGDDMDWMEDPEISRWPRGRLRDLARDLSCRYVVTGEMRSEDSQLRVDLVLYDAKREAEVATSELVAEGVLGLIDQAAEAVLAGIEFPESAPSLTIVPAADRLTGSDEAARAYGECLLALLDRQDVKAARAAVDRALELDDSFTVAYGLLLLVAGSTGDLEAVRHASANLSEHAYRLAEHERYLPQVMHHLTNGRFGKAIAVCETWMRTQPENLEAIQMFGMISEMRGNLDDAVWADEQLHARDPSRADLLLKIARRESERGEHARAIRFAARYVEARPNDVHGHLALGAAHREAGEFEVAAATYDEAELLFPSEPKFQLARLELLKAQGRWKEVERLGNAYLTRTDDEAHAGELRAMMEDPSAYEGIYWDEDVPTAYYRIFQHDDGLMMERPGAFRVELGQGSDAGASAGRRPRRTSSSSGTPTEESRRSYFETRCTITPSAKRSTCRPTPRSARRSPRKRRRRTGCIS